MIDKKFTLLGTITFLLFFLVFTFPFRLRLVYAACTNTTNLSLCKPAVGDSGWGTNVNTNFQLIDDRFTPSLKDFAQETWADDQVWIADSTTAGTPRTITNCTDAGGNHLNYTQSTNSFSCGTSGDGTGTSITTVRKTADETVNNSSTLQNDDELFLAMAANETWFFTLTYLHVGNTTADFKLAFTIPTGATMSWGPPALENVAGGTFETALTITTSGGALSIAADGGNRHQFLSGIVVNGTTAGNLQFQWAQNTATAVNTKVLTNSYLEAHK